MSIGRIGSSALSLDFSLRVRSFVQDSSSDTTATQPSPTDCAGGGMCAAPLAPSTVQAPCDLTGSSGLTVQEALRNRSRTALRTASDGTVSERASAKLRVDYDLTMA